MLFRIACLLVACARIGLADVTEDATHDVYQQIARNKLAKFVAQWNRKGDTCSDVLTTTFFDENEEERDCTWLAEELSNDYNRANLLYCGMVGTRSLVKRRTPLAAVLCPVTCSLPCTYESDDCKDSSALVGLSSDEEKRKKCSWVEKSEQRVEEYCSAEEGVRTRADAACPKTCGKCGQLSASTMTESSSTSSPTVQTESASTTFEPTMAPVASKTTTTSEPTAAPVKPVTSSPTTAPSLAPKPTLRPTAGKPKSPTGPPTHDLGQREVDRQAQCGRSKVLNYDFQKLDPITACDVCVATEECAAAGPDGFIRCCKWSAFWTSQVCMNVEGIWSQKQIDERCV